jgi:Collagen triple helix repeat (20 copies)
MSMLSKIRGRVTARIALLAAIVLAVSGASAYGASRYVITSSKQIKPSVLKELKKPGPAGQNGTNGTSGATGAQGLPGAQGPAGAAGEKGSAGEKGAPGEKGPKGEKGENGEEGSPWTAGGALPLEATETGTWEYGSAKEGPLYAPISFSIPLEKALAAGSVHYVEFGKTTTECPGTVENPKALPGNLCAYQGREHEGTPSFTVPGIFKPGEEFLSPNKGAGKTGAMLVFGEAEGGEAAHGAGTWAVTAPAAA